jgi:nitric oxide dioxygenase
MTIPREQIRLVRDSFPEIAELARPIAFLFYGRLFELAPEVRPMFKQDIAVQGRKLMDMLTTLVGHLDAFEHIEPALEALGQRHAGYGVRPEHYTMVTSSLIWALGRTLDEEFLPDLKAAWVAVIEATATVMKRGAAALPPA